MRATLSAFSIHLVRNTPPDGICRRVRAKEPDCRGIGIRDVPVIGFTGAGLRDSTAMEVKNEEWIREEIRRERALSEVFEHLNWEKRH